MKPLWTPTGMAVRDPTRLLLALMPVGAALLGSGLLERPVTSPPTALQTVGAEVTPPPAALPSLKLRGASLLASLPDPKATQPIPLPPEEMEIPLPTPMPRIRIEARGLTRMEQDMPRRDVPAKRGQNAASLEREALRLLARGENARAEKVLRQVLALEPERLSSRWRLARIWVARGGEGEALALMEESGLVRHRDWHGLVRTDAQAAALLAALFHQRGRPWDAVALYEALLARDHRHGAWWLGLGLALDAVGERDEARSAYGAALTDDRLGREARRHARQRLESGNPP